MASKSLFNSSIGRKFAMALSALFLLIFLLQHFLINALSVINPNGFNEVSAYMSSNPIVQFVMQPILLIGVVYHFVMGFVLEMQNQKARPVKYAYTKGSANSSWASRNMIVSGGVILAFLLVHLWQFWVPTIQANYFSSETGFGEGNYFMDHLNHVFTSAVTLVLYLVAFVFLSLHLQHGFASAFQSIGARHKRYTPFIIAFGKWYSILIPAGFILIAIYHFVNNL
ncbi:MULTISPECIES: succinate dehydrogenase cytochrome b subunit [Weeksella]|uniref:Succinate dehydrogenase (Or fumarate reductase) cytochrome b subunit, b558 family n=1 Tax=Weeksella virosa (strain ATCC 43766 / DSM 16922 / JCM 21250 / CCUG 30538 / CDC 9751 / IAM 14551 / NBRC 16016 / NCTC 11634 / CL345/78) TaxID=865938 RepID=F0NYY8_WEEVC|nr:MULTISPECIES: succinate dehydrogenase cytochrome b subunit [Weeksella]ADX67190.1 succinate dehydrogenase (or fumarate reductase) cytochrome b subunit, b558 family [Weeksella virosa DSM 16922]MDK7375001.1 succinate dehydrogenase cytochrome b subunit [Weeksella virosa]MDK7675961.1 succinate dehydrogenase cytochrome b subunit [Weeksella virosa]OFM81707.1 succinate dehydrogenase [Weeksella sp. HMSC059D05]SUP53460.1 succinate dehydrogenase (or fumarate reductase) cytochrome b subunit, b558 famil